MAGDISKGTPLENSLLTNAKPELDRVLRIIIGVIVLSFHFKYFFPFGTVNSALASWALKRIYGGMLGNKLCLIGHKETASPEPKINVQTSEEYSVLRGMYKTLGHLSEPE